MKTKADYAWKLSRKIIRELLTAALILVLTCVYVELFIIPGSWFVAEVPDITLRRIVFHLIGAGVFCGIYLIIKFRNEDLKDRQFLNDTLNWNDRDLKIFMAPLLIIFPIYMIMSVFVLSVRRIVQLYRLREFFRECVAKLADNPDEITG